MWAEAQNCKWSEQLLLEHLADEQHLVLRRVGTMVTQDYIPDVQFKATAIKVNISVVLTRMERGWGRRSRLQGQHRN